MCSGFLMSSSPWVNLSLGFYMLQTQTCDSHNVEAAQTTQHLRHHHQLSSRHIQRIVVAKVLELVSLLPPRRSHLQQQTQRTQTQGR